MARSLRPKRSLSRPSSWELAQAAVKSFDGSEPLLVRQHNALHRWQAWKRKNWQIGRMTVQHFTEVQKIFSDIFFLEQLGTGSVLQIRWRKVPPIDLQHTGAIIGVSRVDTVPMIISLNSGMAAMRSTEVFICTILHEMVHTFLAGCQWVHDLLEGKPYRTLLPTASRGESSDHSRNYTEPDDLDYGFTAHGRAFMYITKKIEERMGTLLQFTGNLGREAGMNVEIETISLMAHENGGLHEAEPLLNPLLADMADMSLLNQWIKRLLDICDRSKKQKIVEALEKLRDASTSSQPGSEVSENGNGNEKVGEDRVRRLRTRKG